MTDLPPGFQLRQPSAGSAPDLPPGFQVREAPPQQTKPAAPEEGLLDKITRYAQYGQRALLQGMTLGASDEILAAGDAALGRGTLEETLAGRQAQLNEIPDPLRVPAEVAGGILTTAGMGPAVSAGKQMLPYLARVPGLGAIYGFNAGEGGLEERGKSAALGAAGSVAGDALVRGAARVVSPKSSPEVQAMREIGVSPTPGQAMGGAVRKTEEKLASLPVLGDLIRASEGRALEQFNIGTINRALSKAGLNLPKGTKTGREAIKSAANLLNEGYDDALRGQTIRFDMPYFSALQGNIKTAQRRLTDGGFKSYQNVVEDLFSPDDVRSGLLTGERAKQLISDLRSQAVSYANSATAAEREVGKELTRLWKDTKGLLMRSLPKENGRLLDGLDAAYGDFIVMQNAAARAGSKGGEFTPATLRAAVKQEDKTMRKRAFARGDARMQDIAEAGESVLAQTVPNSGTADRALLALGAFGAGAAGINPYVAAGIASPAVVYNPVGQNVLAALMTGRQGPVARAGANALRSMAPGAGVAGAVTANQR